MFIGFGVIVAFKTGNYFYLEHSPFAYPMAALTFGSAIILIAYGGGDLFTGNTFYYTYTALRKKMAWREVSNLWISSYIGNILGAAVFAFIIFTTGLYEESSVNGFLLECRGKENAGSNIELFFRAIFVIGLFAWLFLFQWD